MLPVPTYPNDFDVVLILSCSFDHSEMCDVDGLLQIKVVLTSVFSDGKIDI